jgi:hypothetical protein
VTLTGSRHVEHRRVKAFTETRARTQVILETSKRIHGAAVTPIHAIVCQATLLSGKQKLLAYDRGIMEENSKFPLLRTNASTSTGSDCSGWTKSRLDWQKADVGGQNSVLL